jgi:hypothetical protein
MKRFKLLTIILALTLFLGIGAAQADTLTYSSFHDIHLYLYSYTTSSYITPSNGAFNSIGANAGGVAEYNPTDPLTTNKTSTGYTVGTAASTTAAYNTANWLNKTETKTDYVSDLSGAGAEFWIQRDFKAFGPAPSVPSASDGYSYQYGYATMGMNNPPLTNPPTKDDTYVAAVYASLPAGTYNVALYDYYSSTFQLTPGGSPYFYKYASVGATFDYLLKTSKTGLAAISNAVTLSKEHDGSGYPLSPFTDTGSGTASYTSDFTVSAGTTLWVVAGASVDAYGETTPIPVPASVLLLGTGVLGLGLYGWRRKKH